MAFEEFSGELDKPTGFVEFSGELDSIAEKPERGIIDRVTSALPAPIRMGMDAAKTVASNIMSSKPEYKSVLETQQPTPEQTQAEIDKRLSYGAGPISKETLANADLARSGMGKVSNLQEQKVAQEMGRIGQKSFGEMAQDAKRGAEAAKEEQSVFSRASDELGAGINEAKQALTLTKWAVSGGDTDALSKEMAISMATPQIKTKGEKEIDAAFKRVSDAKGFMNTALEGYRAIATAALNPKDTMLEAIRSAPSSVPTLAGGAAGAVAGIPAGPAGMIALGKTGMAAGTTAIELGSEVRDMVGKVLAERKLAPTAANIKSILDEDGFREEAAKQGAIKGLTVAAVDNIFLGIGGKIATAPAKTALGRAAAGGSAVVVDAAGESLGEGLSQQFARGTVDYGEALREGTSSIGQSAAQTAAGSAIQRVQGIGTAFETPIQPAAPEVSTAEQMARDRGFLTPERPVTQLTNFTPADSPTKAAGLVDVVVPVPVSKPLEAINVGVPSTVGTTDVPSGAGAGTQLGGGVGAAGSGLVGVAQPVAGTATTAQLGGGQVAVAGATDGQQAAAVGALPRLTERTSDADLLARVQQQAPSLQEQAVTPPKQEWYGRRGDGYLTQSDAEQALSGRQRMFPDLQWQVDQLPTGKFRLAGYQTAIQQETALGTQTTQAIQAAQEGQQAPAATAAVTGQQFIADPAVAQTASTVTFSSPSQLGAVKLGQLKSLNSNFERQDMDSGEVVFTRKGVQGAINTTAGEGAGGAAIASTEAFIEPADQVQPTAVQPIDAAGTSAFSGVPQATVQADLGYLQDWSAKQGLKAKFSLAGPAQNVNAKLAEVVARIFKAPIAFVKAHNGKAGFNGFTIGGRLYMNSQSKAPLVTIAMHEVGHNLPAPIKQRMITGVMATVTPEQRAKFIEEFPAHEGDSADVQDEELVMRIIEQDAQNPEFWSALADRMGDSDFAKLAKEVLRVLDRIIAGFTKENSSEFTSDIKKVRELVADAYAEAEQQINAADGKPSQPVTKNEAVVDKVMFSSERRDLVDIPVIDFKDLLGKRVMGIKADLTDAGVSYTGIDGSQLEFPIEMMGGPNYVRLPSNKKNNVVWAVRGGATLTKIMNVVNNSDYILVTAMNGNSHLTNSTVSQAYIQTVEAYLRDNRISNENLLALDEIVRSPDNKNALPDFVGFESPDILSYIDGLSFDQRGALAKILEKKEAQIHGLPNLDRFRRETIDPEYAGYRQGDAMLVIEIDKSNPTVKLGEDGTKMHPSYPLGLRGKVVGKLSKGVNYETIFRDYFENKVPTLKNKEAGAWYAFDRVIPVQEITPEIASSVSEGGYKAIKSARHAEALLAFGNNSWLESGKIKAKGGVSVQEFVDALAANDGAAALTLYTPKDVKDGIKDKSFKVYQLGTQGGDKGLQVFFGLKRGKPWYKDMIDGVSDNEVEVVSVTNNETGASGVGIPAIITKAIQEGATILDAYAVKSKRFPNGFLPEMYREFGFKTIGNIPFDESKVVDKPKGMSKAEHLRLTKLKMADLKKFWSAAGWQEADGYPDVVVMKWTGKDEDRSTAIERYVRSGDTGIPGGDVERTRSAATTNGGQRDRAGVEGGRVGRGNRRQARGDEGASNAAPVVGRAYGGIQELASLGGGDIRNLGLDATEVARLAEPAGRPSVGRDKGDAVKVEGAIHYGRSAGLSVLSGTSFGSGIKGAEQQRLAQPGVDPRIKRRVYFYLPVAGGIPMPEIGLGANVYTANLSNLYDPDLGSLSLPADANAFESGVLDAGYRGYINRAQGTAVVLNSDVPVKAVGKSSEQTMVQRKPQVVAQKISTKESGNDLVRKPTEREMMDIIKVRPQLNAAAPSFKLEFGSARVAKSEANAANTVFKDAGSTFMFSAERKVGIGQALQGRVDNDFDSLVQEYNAIKGTDGGRILDADMARELSPEYRENKTRAAEVHSAVSSFIEKLFKQRVTAAKNTGGLVVLKAGGGGAGKSSANDLAAGPLSNAHTIWDGTLSTPEKADAAVKLVLENNQAAAVVYIYRDPVEALANREGGVLARAMATRRVVPIYSLVKTHTGSSKTVRMLDEKYGSDKRFGLIVVDNSNGKGLAKESSLQDITHVIQSGLKEKLLNETEQAYADGFIDQEIYERTIEGPIGQGDTAQVSAGAREDVQGNERPAQERGRLERSTDALTKLFTDLRGARGLKLARVQEQVENNPLSAAIKNVEENFYDIIGQLEEDGLIKINCK